MSESEYGEYAKQKRACLHGGVRTVIFNTTFMHHDQISSHRDSLPHGQVSLLPSAVEKCGWRFEECETCLSRVDV